MDKIVLNWLPPSYIDSPSPAHSVLKDYLVKNGFNVEVKYWNLLLNDYILNYINYDGDEEFVYLLPFYVYVAIEENDDDLLEKIVYEILSLKPQFHSKGISYLKRYLRIRNMEFVDLVDSILNEMDLDHVMYLGFSSQFYQWIASYMIVRRVKLTHPRLPVIVGGFGTSEESEAFLRNFELFDFSSWGEGENSLLRFSEQIHSGANDFQLIPHLSFRHEGSVVSCKDRADYVSLDQVSFDMSDYFEQINGVRVHNIVLPFETGRGCHWNRCHFCFLNMGYRFRRKPLDSIKHEIVNAIERYHIQSIVFLDNDLIGNDLVFFDKLLDMLIEIRSEHHDFVVSNAEIITKGVSHDLIKKMRLANFKAVQIGYESPSNELLKLIDKKNTLASNLFFIKWATQFGIYMNGMNIIRNLIEEERHHIKEGIDNLRYMRFLLSSGLFTHNESVLAISKSSRYFKKVKKANPMLEGWFSSYNTLYPRNFVSLEDSYILFNDFSKTAWDSLWNIFEKVEMFYRENRFAYSLIDSGHSVVYQEMMNGVIINEIEFGKCDLYWKILKSCNKVIYSIDRLVGLFVSDELSVTRGEVLSAIDELKSEGLVYSTSDYDEIMTVINTDQVFE